MITTAAYTHQSVDGRSILDPCALALWVLSTRSARKHFAKLKLFTDAPGKSVLIDHLRLPFDEVNVVTAPAPRNAHVWAAGKLRSYAAMEEPFIHLDHDVILWKPLPDYMLAAPTCALMEEPIRGDATMRTTYPLAFLTALGSVPPYVWKMAERSTGEHAFNAGVIGGTDLSFLHRYADTALAMLDAPENAAAFAAFNGTTCSVFLEQYVFAALAASEGRTVTTLVTPAEHSDPKEARYRELGFTHFWGICKFQSPYPERILARCQKDYPGDFAKIQTSPLATQPGELTTP